MLKYNELYSEEQIQKIGEYASLLMTITDIAVLIDIDEDFLRSDIAIKSSEVSKVYRLNKAQTILELHRQEIELAKLGSPISVEITNNYIINQQANE